MAEALLAVVMAPRQGANGTFVFFLNMSAVVLIFYFLLIRPQRKEADRQKQMIADIGKGDDVVTSGGIIGTVIRAEEDRLIIRTGDDTKITIERSRVSHKISQDGKGAEAPNVAKK